MKKILLPALILILLFSLALGACSKATPTTTASEALPQNIIFATGPTTGSAYALNSIFADIVTKNTTMKAFVLPTPTMEAGQILAVGEGIANLGQVTAYNAWLAYNGQGDYATGGQRTWLRIVMGGRISLFGFVVRGDSGIKTMADLKGKRVATKYNDITTPLQAAGFLRAAGLDPEKDVQVFSADDSAMANKLMMEGRLDAYFSGATPPYLTEAVKSVGAYVLPFDEKSIQGIGKELPGYGPLFVNGGKYPSIPKDGWIAATTSVIFGKSDQNDATAYAIIKAITDHSGEYAAANAEVNQFNLKQAVMANPPVPYHPGAIKYLKEKGVWSADMDAFQAKFIK